MRGQGLCEDQGEDVGRERVVYNGLLYTLISSVSLETIAERVSSWAVTSANMSPLQVSGWQSSPPYATDVATAAESSVGSTDASGGPIRATFAFLSRRQSRVLSYRSSIGIAIGRSRSKFISYGISRLYFLYDNACCVFQCRCTRNVLLEHVTSIPYFYSLASCVLHSSSSE